MVENLDNDTAKTANRGSRRKEESRRKLLEAARGLFIAKGYHDTRPQDIAKEAGVGHGTFYLHFTDKKACFLAFVAEARDEVTSAAQERMRGVTDLKGQIRAIIDATFDYGEAHPGVYVAAVTDPGLLGPSDGEGTDPNIMEQWGDVWAQIILQHQVDGNLPNDYGAELGGQAVVGMLRQASMVAQRRGLGREELTHSLVRLVLRALGGKI